MPRSLVHVLLSLLLLVSQQLSLGHGYTHWNEVREALAQAGAPAGEDGGGKPQKPGLHDLCGQCAASAQVAFALPAGIRRFIPAELAYAIPSLPATPGICLLTDCVFQSRAPPLA
ncbi:hypothetical protein HH212_15445 [Massilia forsythiae]|uniref:DUF2946 domain-containing protein n=1 Tax=Massilia forsythiae TaxID=2728020 RepID=A0A7Z2ZUN7_9BURK|nr:hypothetical protein [Massilia forsythiae]QJE01257.1 hypothetical protein HH212_15445 [Massilia forsythiae]